MSRYLALYCLAVLCTSAIAKPLHHARHVATATERPATVVRTSINPETFRPYSVQARHEHFHRFVKRDGTWTIQAGDTGNGIAQRLSIEFIQLALLNPAVQWRNLQIGQVLSIPFTRNTTSSTGSTLYTVVAGDTGNQIAATYGTTFSQLDALNPSVDWYNLQIGQTLVIPSPGMDVTGIANLPEMNNVEQDAMVPATETGAPPTFDDGSYKTPKISPSGTGENTVPESQPESTGEESAFLTPGENSSIIARSPEQGEKELVRLRLVRIDHSEELDSNHEQRTQKPQGPPPAVGSSCAVRTCDIRNVIITAHDISFHDISQANLGVLPIDQTMSPPTSVDLRLVSSSSTKAVTTHDPSQDIHGHLRCIDQNHNC